MEPTRQKVTLESIQNTLTEYVKADVAWKKIDMEWKERAQPVIDMGVDLRGAAKVFGWIVGFCLGASAIFAAVKYAWVFFTGPLKPKQL